MLSVIYAECHKKPFILSVVMLNNVHYVECRYAKCHYAESCYAECRYANCHCNECQYADCRDASYLVTCYFHVSISIELNSQLNYSKYGATTPNFVIAFSYREQGIAVKLFYATDHEDQ
jgi:hypothetical protein